MKYNRLTLEFKRADANLEAGFLNYDFWHSILINRVALLLGIALYAVFGVLDYALVGEIKGVFWFVRYAIVCPALLLVYFLSYWPIFQKIREAAIASAIFIAGQGIIAMMIFAPAAVCFTYYAGLILVIMLHYTFAKVRFIWAAVTCWLMVIVYDGVAVFVLQMPAAVLLNNNFFFISANIIGMVVCYYSELYRRKNFYLKCRLENETNKVAEVNLTLENKITELEEASAQIETLEGLIPICSNCKNVRDDKGYWKKIEEYIRKRSKAEFTHGICPQCIKVLYPDYISDPDSTV